MFLMQKNSVMAVGIVLTIFFNLFFLGCVQQGQQPNAVQTFHCDNINCFSEYLTKCEKADYLVVDVAEAVTTKVLLSVEEKRGNMCKISAELLSIELKEKQPENEAEQKVQMALTDFLKNLKGTKAHCTFSEKEVEDANFSNTAFLTKDNCSGELKQKLATLNKDIETIILNAVGG